MLHLDLVMNFYIQWISKGAVSTYAQVSSLIFWWAVLQPRHPEPCYDPAWGWGVDTPLVSTPATLLVLGGATPCMAPLANQSRQGAWPQEL